MNLAETSFLLSKPELNTLDPALYMAVCALIFLLIPIFSVRPPSGGNLIC